MANRPANHPLNVSGIFQASTDGDARGLNISHDVGGAIGATPINRQGFVEGEELKLETPKRWLGLTWKMSRIDRRSILEHIDDVENACNMYIMRRNHSEIGDVLSLPYPNQITYYRRQLAVCANVASVGQINSWLLALLPGVVTRLVCCHPPNPSPGTNFARPGDSRVTLRPNGILRLKRGMIIVLLDNEGHEEYLNTWDTTCRDLHGQLDCEAVAGGKERIKFGNTAFTIQQRNHTRDSHGTATQFPVIGGFAMLAANAYIDPLLVHRSFHR
ncbi:hypothetical protein H4Q26_014866 [Puccinia striiformis f. sp. tritici PST-130]|nr:hypothetical protein H4Q26_014866 [Puccinia striiformis f. sp. tritici PST-130]